MDIQEKFVKMDRNNIEAYTPKYAVDIILPFINKEITIWAPFSKDEHNFAGYLKELGYKVINTHFDPETGEGNDFLTYKPDFYFDIIIDNPPFKGKTKFVKKALSYNKPFMLFLPVNSLGDNGIPNAFIKYNRDIQLLIPDKRTEFENQEKKGISFKTAYLCQGILPRQIIFTKLIKQPPNRE
ncbi:MAG: tRNA (adenine-N(6)-)-methyltransferase [Patescibacteria group bacterium]